MGAKERLPSFKSLKYVMILLVLSVLLLSEGKKEKDDISEAEKWKRKDVRDYSEADMERLFDQWEVGPVYLGAASQRRCACG